MQIETSDGVQTLNQTCGVLLIMVAFSATRSTD